MRIQVFFGQAKAFMFEGGVGSFFLFGLASLGYFGELDNSNQEGKTDWLLDRNILLPFEIPVLSLMGRRESH